MNDHARVKGWRFTFRIDVDEEHSSDPIIALVEGEIGDYASNTWEKGKTIFYFDEEAAIAIARDVVWEHITDGQMWMVNRNQVVWIETAALHPDDFLGRKEVEQGVWI